MSIPKNLDLPKLLRALANSEGARACKHDVILEAAARELEHWRERDRREGQAAREAAFGRYRN